MSAEVCLYAMAAQSCRLLNSSFNAQEAKVGARAEQMLHVALSRPRFSTSKQPPDHICAPADIALAGAQAGKETPACVHANFDCARCSSITSCSFTMSCAPRKRKRIAPHGQKEQPEV
eukprot:CAMPEP_0181212142 /NCGR_PEP_ID=MMETSP1096-20121128/24188_1 /TAXON_ID=156174 ORGANISM="Chrysochromulina ericina, Strain CCMP281" /NCGR_SAMPLE_ID=MMETSP1096 /ASSEMBLY_ACC=CAM_ASM_000453 /LENGTH=117 /DNA_ID=CAMNT_0023303643 /DNA_START=248 /DNA_END=602 /DNA_ORIENTATION=-